MVKNRQLDNVHFEVMQKMRQGWSEQLQQMKQTHNESKADIEDLISRREKQLAELKIGKSHF